jgi:glycosyltransferase involved in cell wall biosynthesis
MSKHYIFFTRNVLPQSNAAYLIHDVNTANAAANLGYSSVLVYLKQREESYNPLDWFYPFRLQKPSENLKRFYSIQDNLNVVSLAMPRPISSQGTKWNNPSTVICKYYFPFHIFPQTKILHTLDWNLIKAAIRAGIPVIYEREHNQNSKYELEIVNHPLFQVAITVADSVRENLIQNGMPPQKIKKLHLSFNQSFLTKQPDRATEWRNKLLKNEPQKLVVYSGGLYKFKGVNLLLDVAQLLPHIHFAFAGGNREQLEFYRKLAREKQVKNVTFLGYIQHEQLPSLLQAADLLAHPHCFGQESIFTSPLKFFEYLASGTPIVATEILPLLEFKDADIMVGWCQPDNPKHYAECLQKTLERYPRKIEGYSKQIEFAKQFSWESRLTKIMSYVDESLLPKKYNNLINLSHKNAEAI